MAPLNEHCVAIVLTSTALSHDESTVLVEAGGFAPMKWFLKKALNPDPEAQAEEVRPVKKRKLGQSKSLRCTAPDPAQHIPISKVAVDLQFPETIDARPAGEAAVKEDVDFEGSESVTVEPSVVDRFGEYRLRLGLPRYRGEVLAVDVAELPESAREAIRRATVSRLRVGDNAYWSRCTLTPSSGQLFTVVRLEVTVFWISGHSAFASGIPTISPERQPDYRLLLEAFPDDEREEMGHSQQWTPQDFYESLHVPSKDHNTTGDFPSLLESDLYPFQKRAVHWMLQREGVAYEAGHLRLLERSTRIRDLDFYRAFEDADGAVCCVNHLQGIVLRKHPDSGATQLSGGLLAEEMGLGKTVELLALLSLNKRPQTLSKKYIDTESGTEVSPSRATLIITPNTILQQWKSELANHAPALKVFHYEGVTSKGVKAGTDMIEDMASNYDVVLSTYSTLTREVHYAEDPPKRDMRHARKYERKTSPLVRLQWWRICLDEAQMVESGVTAAARVARRLPRVHSWAVSGTPLKKNVQDLHGLLIFLGYYPLSENAKLWTHLINNHRHLFRQIFGRIALRHTKAQIRDDIQLPQQKRVVVTVPFSATEQHNYRELFDQMCKDVGVANDGSPIRDEWDPDDAGTVAAMSNWLVRLRQSCLHPQVGGQNRKALGRGRGPLRTVAEVLQVMIEQNEVDRRVEERALLGTKLLRGHILGNVRANDRRSEEALESYRPAMNRSGELVKEARQKLAAAKQAHVEKGKATSDTDVDEEDSVPELGRLRNNLRTALQLEHTCTFFAATACYQIKTNIDITEPDTERFRDLENQETELYEHAKALRKEILKDSSRKSEALMRKINHLVKSNAFTKLPKVKDLDGLGGIESRRVLEKADDLFVKIREQGKLVAQWRAKMAEYLLKPLVDKDEGLETTGDEYEDSTKLQDELYVYFDVFKSIDADLIASIKGEEAPLIDHEMKIMLKNAKSALDKDTPEEMKAKGIHAPELAIELLVVRNKLRSDHSDHISIRGLIQEARALESSVQGYDSGIRAAEHAIARQHINALQAIFTSYSKVIAGVQKEVDLFRMAQNQRLEFYRQLQEISDDVQPYTEELDLQLDLEALNKATERQANQAENLKQLGSKHTFLKHLREKDQDEDRQEPCTVCREDFWSGVLTVCGHKYCKDCTQSWLLTHKRCAFCRRYLTTADLHDITFKTPKIHAQEEEQSGSSSPLDKNVSPGKQGSIYSDVDSQLLQEVNAIDLPASYGTKIDTLGRHLYWLREHDPGAKSIVFSQYREFLDVLGPALREFRIGYARLGKGSAVEKFKRDPAVDCLLLDAKTDSSGLTLVNATHVFLCEPLIQTAVELQAIARVHRIGQTRPTTVWMYLIKDTVEEAIYDISVARHLAHVQARQSNRAQKSRSTTPAPLQEKAIDAANSEEMQSAPLTRLLVSGKGGGELVREDDLWQCLFGKAQKSVAETSIEEPVLVSRHRRAEAAEQRRTDAMEVE